ncbi:hypothetical protein C463_17383 [Halorubrum californiense DSM 19288]|uniref:Uncharacterized protein n=1 Tax=Halorubrum californiense DSM 19288 TaxID=1227465 RepID=M0DYN5_9EURY|nr:hypothetical protein [Halorubrum californiense]ELZ39214.1 hypothetical protein C463_17383 [Halorubrum californiense DSM 19288]
MSDQSDSPASRRVMDTLGTGRQLPIVGIDERDLYVLVGFPIAGLVGGAAVGADALVLPLVCVGLAVGVAVVYAAPRQLPASTWLADLARFYLRRPRVTLHAAVADEATAGGSEGVPRPFAVDEHTQALTGIKRAWPGHGAIEQADGTMATYVEVTPGNMDFAMADDWAARQAVGEAFADQELTFQLTLYTTTEPYPAATLVDQLEARLADPDVSANESLRRLIAAYREQRPADLADTHRVRYFLGVQVAPYDVYERHPDERTPAERLTTLPVVGVLVTPFVTRRERLTEAELRGAQLETLRERVRTIETEFIGKTSDAAGRRLSTAELLGLATQFWTGSDSETPPVATHAGVDHETRGDRNG